MIKSDLVWALSLKFKQYPEKTVNQAVNLLIESMAQTLAEGKRIEIRGFGSFGVRYRAKRKARNPKTGETLEISAKYLPYFKAGKELRAWVDEKTDGRKA